MDNNEFLDMLDLNVADMEPVAQEVTGLTPEHEPGQCYFTSFKYFAHGYPKTQLIAGEIAFPNGVRIPHCWLMEDGKVIEVTRVGLDYGSLIPRRGIDISHYIATKDIMLLCAEWLFPGDVELVKIIDNKFK